MKRLGLVFTLSLMLCCLCATAFASGAKLAVVPYINSSEETKDYVGETVDEHYTDYFQKMGYEVLPTAQTAAALAKTGYSKEDESLPEKEQLAEVARATGADYVVAMEIAELHASRHISFFQEKVTAKTKLAYCLYAAGTDKLYSFKSTGADDNKTVIGGVGFKSPITNVLKSAMGKANDKINAYIAENH